MPGHRLVPRADSASVADRRETAGRTREEGEKGKVPMGRTRKEGEKRKDVVAPIRVPFSRRERERDGVVERMTDLVQHTAAATVCAENSCINRLEQRRARLVVHTVCVISKTLRLPLQDHCQRHGLQQLQSKRLCANLCNCGRVVTV